MLEYRSQVIYQVPVDYACVTLPLMWSLCVVTDWSLIVYDCYSAAGCAITIIMW